MELGTFTLRSQQRQYGWVDREDPGLEQDIAGTVISHCVWKGLDWVPASLSQRSMARLIKRGPVCRNDA